MDKWSALRKLCEDKRESVKCDDSIVRQAAEATFEYVLDEMGRLDREEKEKPGCATRFALLGYAAYRHSTEEKEND